MKKIIPFKKEIKFNTKISEISSISLEHTLSLKESDLISGEFHISGEYKILDASIKKEPFDYIIPFDIALDSRLDATNMIIDIDDFYYEVLEDTLKINIDVFLEGDIIADSEKKVIKETDEPLELINEERCLDEEQEIIYDDIPKEILKGDDPMDNDNIVLENLNNNANTNNNINLFDSFNGPETFSTYLVYIVKENDTLDKILENYKITKEQLENYNDLSNINKGDKLIIPSNNE